MHPRRSRQSLVFAIVAVAVCGTAAACGSSGGAGSTGDTSTQDDASASSGIDATSAEGSTTIVTIDGSTVNEGGSAIDSGTPGPRPIFVIPLENKGEAQIYGDTTDAPYINDTLLADYPHTTMFTDELPLLDSEPHYIWMESGTNALPDHSFTTDDDPSKTNSTSSTQHLSAQLTAAGISWTSYQEGITAGKCPVSSITANFYAAKHDPFVFFQDVSGTTPSASNATCAAHHKPITALATDLAAGTAATYNFITPDLCHEMHGDANCPSGTADATNIAAGDTWLMTNLPAIIDYALARNGFVFLTWDEGDSTNLMPFIAIGKNAIAKRAGTVAYTHSSLLKSEEEILGVPVLTSVASANDFADLFTSFP